VRPRPSLAEAGWSPLAELAADEATSKQGHIDVVQPLLFALSLALAALWRSWGVEPDAVVGHSLGEVAAAQLAGVLSLADAAAIVCRRSALLRRICGRGEMALVELSVAEAEALLRGHEDRLSVAVSNGPRATVIAGEPAALGEVLAALTAREVFHRRSTSTWPATARRWSRSARSCWPRCRPSDRGRRRCPCFRR
jgi:acyl transferase domain-containing protein